METSIRGSIARKMLANLYYRVRHCKRLWMISIADVERNSESQFLRYVENSRCSEYSEASNALESSRRIFYSLPE